MAEAYLSDRFIHDSWYVAAWDHEIGSDAPFPRTLRGNPRAFYPTAPAPRASPSACSISRVKESRRISRADSTDSAMKSTLRAGSDAT